MVTVEKETDENVVEKETGLEANVATVLVKLIRRVGEFHDLERR